MLFWFSGSGNSEYVSKVLEKELNEKRISIKEAHINKQWHYDLEEGESIGFVFPTYYWGVPTIVDEFLSQIQFTFSKKPYVYAIITCGQSSGLARQTVKKRLQEKGLSLN